MFTIINKNGSYLSSIYIDNVNGRLVSFSPLLSDALFFVTYRLAFSYLVFLDKIKKLNWSDYDIKKMNDSCIK